jgi:hypothetical protein
VFDLFLLPELLEEELAGCDVNSKRCVEVLTRPLRRGSGAAFSTAEEPRDIGTDDVDSSIMVF